MMHDLALQLPSSADSTSLSPCRTIGSHTCCTIGSHTCCTSFVSMLSTTVHIQLGPTACWRTACPCRFSSNAAAEDTDVQFRVWAIKSAVKRVPLYVQV
jgi:hypothetical protein